MNDRTTRGTPPRDEDDYQAIWQTVERMDQSWPFLKVIVAVFGNWKAIGLGVMAGLAFGGKEILQAWGWL